MPFLCCSCETDLLDQCNIIPIETKHLEDIYLKMNICAIMIDFFSEKKIFQKTNFRDFFFYQFSIPEC